MQPMDDKPLRSTLSITALTSICVVVVVCLGLFAYQSLVRLSEGTEVAAEALRERLDLAQLLEMLVQMGGGVRIYQASGNTTAFDDAQAAAAMFPPKFAALAARLSGDEIQRPLLEELRNLAVKRQLQTQQVRELALRGDTAGVNALIASGEGARIMDASRALVVRMQTRQAERLRERLALVTRARDTVTAAIAVTTALATMLLVLVALVSLRYAVRLRRAQEELATTLRSIGDAVISTDGHGQVRFMNAVAEQLTGWSNAAAQGLSLDRVFNICNESTRDAAESPVRRVLRENRVIAFANHTLLITRNGDEIPIENSGAPIYGAQGEVFGVVVVFRDATLKRAAQQALLDREAQLREANATLEERVTERTAQLFAQETLIRTFYEHSSECHAVLEVTEEGAFRYEETNPATLRLYNKRREEVIGRTVDEVFDAKAAAVLNTYLRACLTTGAPFDYERAHGEGTIEAIATPVPHTADGRQRIVVSARDVTERRALEEQLLQSRKMEAVGQLTGGLAHDFNNLLSGISGSLELLQTRVAQGRVNDLDRFVKAGQGAARRAAALTHRLLAFARRQTLDAKPTDVNRLIAGLEDLISRTVGPEIDLGVVGGMGLWHPSVDANQLENAVLNLCINARDAMPSGGKITIETANRWIDERMGLERELPAGQYVSICVSDTGCGMSPDVAARAFDPFFTTKPLGQGTGLGLSMIYGFARQSGGQVRIYSEPGQGTVVCIYLPRASSQAVPEEPSLAAPSSHTANQGDTVLVVDDEPVVRMLVAEVLQDLGYVAIECEDGVAALKVLESSRRLDLMITDVGLPNGINGRQLADAGRALRPALRVLFITGYAENAVMRHGHLEHGLQVITKPFAISTLADRVASLMQGPVSDTPPSRICE